MREASKLIRARFRNRADLIVAKAVRKSPLTMKAIEIASTTRS